MPDRPDIRGYQGRSDLELLLAFASRSLTARFPLPSCWHPGDIIWLLKPDYDRPHRVRMWLSSRGAEAVVMFMGVDQVWLELLPDSEHLLPEIVAHAERARLRGAEGAVKLSFRVYERDAQRIAALERLGYLRGEPDHVWFRRDLGEPLPDFPAPHGFRVRDSVEVDPVLRAKVHRDAWNDLSQIGIPDARSGFTTEVYLGIRDAPVYDPSLDILVEAENGEFVANTICWADPASGIGIFEPVGAHAKYRQRGLARFAMLEGMRRLKARGMAWAGVGTAHFNAPAIAAYSSFFPPLDSARWWTKTLSPAS
jgi:hypothetical protein